MKQFILLTVILAVTFLVACAPAVVDSYETCIAAGHAMMKSSPPQCSDGEFIYTQGSETVRPADFVDRPGSEENPEVERCSDPKADCNDDFIIIEHGDDDMGESTGLPYPTYGEGTWSEDCAAQGGSYNSANHECVGIDQQGCDALDGNFDECASACRNNPDAEICTMQCVQVCYLPGLL